MSKGDPLSFFQWEKVAADLQAQEAAKHEPDPGDKTVAGLAVASGAWAKWGGRLSNAVLTEVAQKGSVKIKGTPTEIPGQGKFLGLFPLESRPHPKDPEFTKKLEAMGEKVFNTVDSFIDKHKLEGVKVDIRSGPFTSLLGPRYSIPNKTVHLPVLSKEVALHELGHAADYTSGKIGKLRGFLEPGVRNAAYLGLPIAMIAGDRISKMIPGSIDDRAISFLQENAPTIMGATIAATTLYPEAKASVLALRHIKATEGLAAAQSAAKKLIPAWSSYALAAIAPVVGLVLAKRYLHRAREAKPEQTEKVASAASGLLGDIVSGLKDVQHVAKQIGQGTKDLITQPGTAKRLAAAAKEVGTSPQFLTSALSTAVPASMAALYIYGTPGGKEILKTQPEIKQKYIDDPNLLARQVSEDNRHRHPLAYAGMVGLGTAFSAGILSHLFSDLAKVL